MFEMFEDWDYEALGVAVVIVALFAVFLLIDPLKVGMDQTPFLARFIAILVMIPLGYIIAYKMTNQ